MTVMTFSGWGQTHDSLNTIAPGAYHVPYSRFASIDQVFEHVGSMACHTAIGWSLGGQVLLRAIHAGAIHPKLVILLATPYAFVRTHSNPYGIDPAQLTVFRQQLHRQPERLLRYFSQMIAMDDTRRHTIIKELTPDFGGQHWRYWLEVLAEFSCKTLSLTTAVPMTLIHGKQDAIVDIRQTSHFQRDYPHCDIIALPGAGHAPHLHAPATVKTFLQHGYSYAT